VKLLDGVFYHSQDPMHPEVGFIRQTGAQGCDLFRSLLKKQGWLMNSVEL